MSKKALNTNDSQTRYIRRPFKPMAGYFLLYLILFAGVITLLKPTDYDSLAERIFWGLITFSLVINIRRHWPAMIALLASRGNNGS